MPDLPPNDSTSNDLTWAARVEIYVDQLEEVAETIDLILDETRVGVVGVQEEQIHESTAQLQASLERLETMVARRDELLRDLDAPDAGLTLTAKLKSTFQIEDARLAKHCQEVSEKIQTTHQRALSMFVCQYHLSDLTGDILKTLLGSQMTDTYQKDGNGNSPSKSGQGGLFDEAA